LSGLAFCLITSIQGIYSTHIFSALTDSQNIIKKYFLAGDYIGILGTIPEILWLLESIINQMIDIFYWLLIDKKRRVMIHESSTDNIQLYNQ
jgi:hypothetical protein